MRSTTYLRWTPGHERRTSPGRYEPLAYASPNLGEVCSECGNAMRGGDRVTLFAVGPDNLEAAEHDRAGTVYNALAVVMHEACAWPSS